ncbi:MAG TPA: flagellar basal body rod protein FlgB [Beijerinckiaceae bacterium]|jgi:flagellar basal-body rod protein FlgB
MSPLFLLGLATQNAQWLTTRQLAVTRNIANANTPGYRTLDVRPFAETLQTARVELASTRAGHLGMEGRASEYAIRPSGGQGVSTSGNDVSMEQELMKSGDIGRAYNLNASIVRSFQRMLLASVKAPA